MASNLLTNVHEEPTIVSFGNKTSFLRGTYDYYHYGCDGKDDRGWGCGYRTLQSLCSWVKYQHHGIDSPNVPSLLDIQTALVKMGDKPERFISSRDWIGSFEVCLCLDFFYNANKADPDQMAPVGAGSSGSPLFAKIPCKILHIGQGKCLGDHLQELWEHFDKRGSPIMMGGDTDNSSKGILGVSLDPPALLVMDPHFYGQRAESAAVLVRDGWLKWVLLEEFTETSFYNLCLPQLVAK